MHLFIQMCYWSSHFPLLKRVIVFFLNVKLFLHRLVFLTTCKKKKQKENLRGKKIDRTIYFLKKSKVTKCSSLLPPADDIKPCPRCGAYIIKMNDGSCNHMTCAVCGCEFCWLCMKEISDLHYLRYRPSLTLHTSSGFLSCASVDSSLVFLLLSFQSFWLYVLGEEALEQEEEDPVAAGNPDRRPGGHHPHRRHRRSRHGHRHSRLHRPQGEKQQKKKLQQHSDLWEAEGFKIYKNKTWCFHQDLRSEAVSVELN